MSDLKLTPKNRKAVYHSLGNVMADLQAEKTTVASAMAVAKLASEMSKILQYNFLEYRIRRTMGEPEFKMKEIEKDFD